MWSNIYLLYNFYHLKKLILFLDAMPHTEEEQVHYKLYLIVEPENIKSKTYITQSSF